MGERAKGKDKGKAKKAVKTAKAGRRPHEQRQQSGVTRPPTDPPA